MIAAKFLKKLNLKITSPSIESDDGSSRNSLSWIVLSQSVTFDSNFELVFIKLSTKAKSWVENLPMKNFDFRQTRVRNGQVKKIKNSVRLCFAVVKNGNLSHSARIRTIQGSPNGFRWEIDTNELGAYVCKWLYVSITRADLQTLSDNDKHLAMLRWRP